MVLVPFRRQDGWMDPFRELEKIQDEVNQLFDFSRSRSSDAGEKLTEPLWNPAVDLYEWKDNLVVKVDLPGMSKEDISVTFQGDTLVIRGEKKRERETREGGFIRTERAYGSFYRAIALPGEVDADKVKAVYKNGVLELTLPKTEESKPKSIAI